MDAVRRLANLARAARDDARLRVRQPLRRMLVAVPPAAGNGALSGLLEVLRAEVNVKAIEVVASDAELVRLRPRPNFRSLGKRFGKRTPEVAAAATRLTPEQLRGLEAGQPATLQLGGEAVTYEPEDLVIEREVTSRWLVQSSGAFVVALDPELDDALRREGFAREVVNRIQRLRKDAGYTVTTRIALWIDGDAAVLDAVRAHREFIGEETLAQRLELGVRASEPDLEQQLDIEGTAVVVGVRRSDEPATVAAP